VGALGARAAVCDIPLRVPRCVNALVPLGYAKVVGCRFLPVILGIT
jgi:hypothetical protein